MGCLSQPQSPELDQFFNEDANVDKRGVEQGGHDGFIYDSDSEGSNYEVADTKESKQ